MAEMSVQPDNPPPPNVMIASVMLNMGFTSSGMTWSAALATSDDEVSVELAIELVLLVLVDELILLLLEVVPSLELVSVVVVFEVVLVVLVVDNVELVSCPIPLGVEVELDVGASVDDVVLDVVLGVVVVVETELVVVVVLDDATVRFMDRVPTLLTQAISLTIPSSLSIVSV